MSSSNLSGLSDQIGDLTPNTPADNARALAAAMRAAQTREEAQMFREQLFGKDGLGDLPEPLERHVNATEGFECDVYDCEVCS